MKVGLLYKLMLGVWAMRPESAEAYFPLVHEFMMGSQPAVLAASRAEAKRLKLMDFAGIKLVTQAGEVLGMEQAAEELDPTTQDLVAVIPIHGAIMKDDWCGDFGTRSMANWISEFNGDPAIAGIVLDMDSPGGDGYGMFHLTSQLDRTTKPVVSLVQQGMACSAGYGIVSKTNLILAGSEVDEFGSIGTYVTLADYDAYWKAKGLPIHKIKATKSTEKNADFEAALEGKYDNLRKNYIDPFNEAFINMVKAARPGMEDKNGVFNGRVLFAPEALKAGMIDSVGHDLNSAVASVRELAKKTHTTS